MLTETVKLIGEGLEDDETYRGECPVCGRPKVFTVTRNAGVLLYNCYRASCGIHGRIGGVRKAVNLLYNKREKKRPKLHPFTGALEHLSDEWIDFLSKEVGFDNEHIEMAYPLYAPGEHRIAYPIYSPMGTRRGFVLRSYTLGVEPKALTRMDVEEPHMSWYRPRPEVSEVLVVEDIPSAVRAARYYPQTVALCGTGAGIDYVAEIAQFARSVTWALDADATRTALKWHRKYSALFEASGVLRLRTDLKDMSESALRELLAHP